MKDMIGLLLVLVPAWFAVQGIAAFLVAMASAQPGEGIDFFHPVALIMSTLFWMFLIGMSILNED